MKNELETLENTFRHFENFQQMVDGLFKGFQYEAFKRMVKYTSDETTKIKSTLNGQTKDMKEQNHIKLFISQYLVQLRNILQDISKYKGIYEIMWRDKLAKISTNGEPTEEEKLFHIELHYLFAIKLCENEIQMLSFNLIRDYEYFFDGLNPTEPLALMISDFKKKQSGVETENKIAKVKWNKTAKEFVKMFHPLIKNSTLSFQGQSDVETIMRLLYNSFEIEKTKGEGIISYDTLSTYFKKENTGDTY